MHTVIDPATLAEIIELVLQAPSADNLQPWALRWQDSRLALRFVPAHADSLLHHDDFASRIAFGGVLENLELATSARGYSVAWQLDPEPGDRTLWASATFAPASVRSSPLADAIPRRCTNRARFDASPLSPDEHAQLAAHHEPGVQLRLFAQRAEIGEIASFTGLAESARSTIRRAHEDLHRGLRWSAAEAERTRDGLDVRTLGLSSIERVMLKFFAPWPRMRRLLAVGGAALQARYARKLAATGSAFASFEVLETTPSYLMAAGRLIQRVWLQATALDLAVSPFAALPLLGMMRTAQPELLTDRQRAQIDLALTREHALRGSAGSTCVLWLRIGRAPTPRVRALRRARVPLALGDQRSNDDA